MESNNIGPRAFSSYLVFGIKIVLHPFFQPFRTMNVWFFILKYNSQRMYMAHIYSPGPEIAKVAKTNYSFSSEIQTGHDNPEQTSFRLSQSYRSGIKIVYRIWNLTVLFPFRSSRTLFIFSFKLEDDSRKSEVEKLSSDRLTYFEEAGVISRQMHSVQIRIIDQFTRTRHWPP